MSGKMLGTLIGMTVLAGLGGIAAVAGGARQASGQATSADDRAGRIAKGREIFVAKCAKCHNERGDKALSSGKPLSERGLATEAIARAVRGRLKDRTDDERQAVTLYIASLMKKD